MRGMEEALIWSFFWESAVDKYINQHTEQSLHHLPPKARHRSCHRQVFSLMPLRPYMSRYTTRKGKKKERGDMSSPLCLS